MSLSADYIKSKIYTDQNIRQLPDHWQNEKVVFTNGCFDILHRGHIDYLLKARLLGDRLFIGVNSDRSVSRLKGKGRPVQDEQSRLMLLASLGFVDAVMLFDEDTPENLIRLIRPQTLVKGGDYKKEEIAGYDFVKSYNGEVYIIDFLPGYSTSAIEHRIKNS